MKYINANFDIPFYNFALEKHLITNPKFNDDYFFFYIHKPSVIIGKHQNAYEELNLKFISDNNIYVARRLSGGGCVYHDEGNLNFSFITRREKNQNIDFTRYTEYIINALKAYGVNAQLQGRNDLCVNGKKFSGNAQYLSEGKVLHHGTLMVDVNIENMLNALNVSNIKIESKAIKSVRSRVINLAEVLPDKIDINNLKNSIISEIFDGKNVDVYSLTQEDINAIDDLATNQFATDSYNFGIKKTYNITKKRKYPAGIVQANMNVNKNIIQGFKITGDFFANEETTHIEQELLGSTFNKSVIYNKLKKINFDGVIKNFTTEEMIDLLFF